jgi:ATP-dependent RNA helicase RhlE
MPIIFPTASRLALAGPSIGTGHVALGCRWQRPIRNVAHRCARALHTPKRPDCPQTLCGHSRATEPLRPARAASGGLSETDPHMQFSSLELSSPILRALTDQGYETPTPIQAAAIGPILKGHDVLGCAQTGTGKTAAFALPILDRLLRQPADKSRRGPAIPRCLVLSPTRELACQIGDSFATYGRHTGLRQTVVYGGVKQIHQERALRKGVDVLVATPGRLIDLGEQGIVDLSAVTCFVLDEADRMLDMGFIQPIREIASHLYHERQTLLFSATMPREIKRLANALMNDPVHVAVTPVASAAPLIDQTLYMVPRGRKLALLRHIVEGDNAERALVFTRTKHGAEKVTRQLNRLGIDANSIHGNKTQNQRQRALDGFRRGHTRVLVATDVAARGLDVDNISHVFNFDLPMDPEAYVHRIGRTGRAGLTGIAISFCDPQERSLLREIVKLTGKEIDTITKLPKLPDDEASTRSPRRGEGKERGQNGATHDHFEYREQRRSGGRTNGASSRSGHGSDRRTDRSGERSASPARAKQRDAVPAAPPAAAPAGAPNRKKSTKRKANSDTQSRDFGDAGYPRKKYLKAKASGGAGESGGGGGGGSAKSRRKPKPNRASKSLSGVPRPKRKVHRKGNARPGSGVRSASPRG